MISLSLIGSQRSAALHRYPASFTRNRGRFLANGLGTRVSSGCHGERGGEREASATIFSADILCCTFYLPRTAVRT